MRLDNSLALTIVSARIVRKGNEINMIKHISAGLLGLSILLSGCMNDEATVGNTDSEAATAQSLQLSPNAFVNLHLISGFHCASNEVMIGSHWGHENKSICAALNFGYKVLTRLVDPACSLCTKVDSNPSLHGCPADFFVQGFDKMGPGEDEALICVSLQTANNIALTYSSTRHDGRGPNDNGTKSTTEYNISPEMHACPRGFAMAGIHQSQNDLWCAN